MARQKLTLKEKKLAEMTPPRDKITRGDIIAAAKSRTRKASGGTAKIKKVIKGLNKASNLHKKQAKSLSTVIKKKKKKKKA